MSWVVVHRVNAAVDNAASCDAEISEMSVLIMPDKSLLVRFGATVTAVLAAN